MDGRHRVISRASPRVFRKRSPILLRNCLIELVTQFQKDRPREDIFSLSLLSSVWVNISISSLGTGCSDAINASNN